MKIPCEIVVWCVLPMIRREIARELVQTYSMSQAEVARRFGVTDAAISQYLKKKRGGCVELEDNPLYIDFLKEVSVSSERIAVGGCECYDEMCRLCGVVKGSGLLAVIYKMQTGTVPPKCPQSYPDQ